MSYGQCYLLAKTTWILSKDLKLSHNTIPTWYPMSSPPMVQLPIVLTVAHLDPNKKSINAYYYQEPYGHHESEPTWTSNMAEIMDCILPIFSALVCWAIVLGTVGGQGTILTIDWGSYRISSVGLRGAV